METKTVHLANFNCTFSLIGEIHPMLDYFNSLLLPAVLDTTFARKTKNGNFYLAEVALVDIGNDDKKEIALIGKHVKKVQLDIRNDYDPITGFIPVGERHPSAPFSTFILLLRNHRLIHFGDQKGSPNVRTLAGTFENAIKSYRRQIIKDVQEAYQKSGTYPDTLLLGEVSKVRFPDIKDLRRHLSLSVPIPTINVVPIPHPNIVAEKIKEFSRIEELSFKVFSLNSEMQVNALLRQFTIVSEEMKTSTASGTFKKPSDFDKVTEFVKDSKGQADVKMVAYRGKNKISMSTDDFVENIYLEVPPGGLLKQGQTVYSELREKEELQTNSTENLNNYKNYLNELR